jgi:hypothetical protein
MAKRKPKEKDAIDLLLDQIDFHGLTQEDVLGQNILSPENKTQKSV